MNKCKRCKSENTIKNGYIRGKQRYKCKECSYVYVRDEKQKIANESLDALVVLLYSTGKASYRFIGKLLGVSNVTVYKWLKRIAKSYPDNNIPKECKEIEIDEMWHFINKKKENTGCLRRWIEEQGNALHGLQGEEILAQFVNYIKKLHI